MRTAYPNNNLQVALAGLPFYGGTTPTGTESSSTTDTGTSQEAGSTSGGQSGTDTSQQAGGDSGSQQQMDPQQIADLLKQVSTLTSQNKQLLTENNTFKAQQQQKERENMGREQALETDLQNAMETIEKMDRALKNQAIMNAIGSFDEIQFHDPNFVLHELGQDILENMEVDLENGTVTVSGIENDLRRIAKEKSWAVKKVAQQEQQQTTQTREIKPKGSGAPPPPPGGSGDKASRRAALIDKFPVIGHGRAATG